MKIVIRSCSECPVLFYTRSNVLTCTFGFNLAHRTDDPRFPCECPMKQEACVIKVDPIPTCDKCGWCVNEFCRLYNGRLERKNDKEYRLSICMDNERQMK